jgi:hypothetical protein
MLFSIVLAGRQSDHTLAFRSPLPTISIALSMFRLSHVNPNPKPGLARGHSVEQKFIRSFLEFGVSSEASSRYDFQVLRCSELL